MEMIIKDGEEFVRFFEAHRTQIVQIFDEVDSIAHDVLALFHRIYYDPGLQHLLTTMKGFAFNLKLKDLNFTSFSDIEAVFKHFNVKEAEDAYQKIVALFHEWQSKGTAPQAAATILDSPAPRKGKK